jgi:hypothetical protein
VVERLLRARADGPALAAEGLQQVFHMVGHDCAALSRIATKPDIGRLGLAIEQTVNQGIDQSRSRVEILIDLFDRHTGTVCAETAIKFRPDPTQQLLHLLHHVS